MEEGKKTTFSRFLVTGALILGVFVSGVLTGTSYGMRALLHGDNVAAVNSVTNLFSPAQNTSVSFDQFWTVWKKIQEKYVYKPVTSTDLFYGSMVGLVQSLGDPYSVYMPPAKAEEFRQDLSGEFFGIGAEVGLKDGKVTVIAPLPKSPAEKAGLRTGDVIIMVDGKDVTGKGIDEVISQIRGPKGTVVTLTILKSGAGNATEIKITRDVITVPTVTWSMKDKNIAYLRISYFNDTTWGEFDKIAKEITDKNPKGIVLDLRSNPGGYLDTSVKVASEWVNSGVIVYEKLNDGYRDQYTADAGKHRFVGIPTIILVDEGTASGAEIVSGALQDYGVAQLVGNKTFGKGSVQDFEYFPDGSALKLTIAEWLTPHERHINKKGIEPDVKIEKMFVQKEGTDGTSPDHFDDVGLEKALELLHKK
ncbi:MAG TPA: S41 family peptidase [Candidatus Magasanikbacteria bacterium]|nr:S41 family peptidase [Candidatus Magasanikbacteria bacterium]